MKPKPKNRAGELMLHFLATKLCYLSYANRRLQLNGDTYVVHIFGAQNNIYCGRSLPLALKALEGKAAAVAERALDLTEDSDEPLRMEHIDMAFKKIMGGK